jgi:TrmH family RNA methyltransferase
MKMISSIHNPEIKNLVKLRKSREREKQGFFLIEGDKEIRAALESGVNIQNIYVGPGSDVGGIKKIAPDEDLIIEVGAEVMKKISYAGKEEGVVAVATCYEHGFEDMNDLSGAPLIIVLENVEKPGNLGAIIRTAISAGVDAIIVNDMQTDIFNPNVVRSSLGGLFSIKIINASSQETYNWLKKRELNIYATSAHGNKSFWDVDYVKGFGLVLGSESQGLSSFWRERADHLLAIPLKSRISSLNVSVAGGVVIYEALRQRRDR